MQRRPSRRQRAGPLRPLRRVHDPARLLKAASGLAEIRSDHRFSYAADRAAVWRALEGVDDYPRWWPWLRRFDAGPLAAGERWTCVARPPVPYVVRFTLALDDVVAPDHVDATVSGDIAGRALLTLTDRAGACELRLQAVLAPARPLLRAVTTLLPPVARYGHDRLITTGAGQFGAVALGSGPALPS